jgi:hypothetical protein
MKKIIVFAMLAAFLSFSVMAVNAAAKNSSVKGEITAIDTVKLEVTVKDAKGIEIKVIGTKDQVSSLKVSDIVRINFSTDKDVNKIVSVKVSKKEESKKAKEPATK